MAFVVSDVLDERIRNILNDGTTPRSIAADFETPCLDVLYHNIGSIEMSWTGADATDALLIPQGSNSKTCWADLLTGSLVKKVDSPADCHIYTFRDLPFKYLRIKFTANSNTTGTIDFVPILKRIGGGHLN